MCDKQFNKAQIPLVFGFDIGIASVGWAVLTSDRIIDLGVRAFDKAETTDKGESLNKARRDARLMRRRLQHRKWRLTKLARFLKKEGLISDTGFFTNQKPFSLSLWKLRVDGLDRLLSNEEWARVIYHLCKHRGFHWYSRAEEKSAESGNNAEVGKVKQGLTRTKQLMLEKNYRSAAEMVLSEFPEAQRNKQGDYSKALSRSLLAEELKLLFECQRKFGNSHANAEFEAGILGNGDKKSGLFWRQNPALAGDALLKMLGHCTFEKEEYRAPKASFTAERHVWLTRLNNLRIVVDGITRPLTADERNIVINLPYQQSSEFKYYQLRNALVKNGLTELFRFTGLAYPSDKQKSEEKAKDPEDEKLIKLPAWQTLRKKLKEKNLEAEWQKISVAALDGDSLLLDQIASILSIYKEDDEVKQNLEKLDLPNKALMIEALCEVSFKEFHALSLKALRKIVPFMEQGFRYDEACEKAGYHHSQLFNPGDGSFKYLPPFYSGRDRNGRMLFNKDMDIPRNPVVLRALNQARKVVNALVREFGSPYAIHIEMARDLSRPFDERKKVEKAQNEYRDRNEKDKAQFAEDFSIAGTPKGKEFEKYQLYREQQGKCVYSLEPLDIQRALFEQGYAEIDHALPYSRSFDDSKNNRVLVFSRENRNKGNKTPYEYLDGASNSERWRQFEVFVNSNKSYRPAKRNRLLKKDFNAAGSEEFRERNLNDTRYICRFFKNYIERYLQLHEDNGVKRCVVVSGQLTAFLRARWGLVKVRAANDRHHALDAAVVAACSHSMVKHLSDYSRRRELEQVRTGFVDIETGEVIDPAMLKKLETHFPNPWNHFRDELLMRLNAADVAGLRSEAEKFGTYPAEALNALKPLFVSRAPQRRSGGAAHKETIYSQPERIQAEGGVTQKVPLHSLTLKDLDKLIDPHRNEKLYAAIRERLENHGGKGEKAFPLDDPLRKPGRNGKLDGPIVRSVKMVIDKLSGIPVRGGVARNDTMLRVDIFGKSGKFYLVPVYVHHKVFKEQPNRAIVAYKDETAWTLIDDSFAFCFSLYPNDLVKVTLKKAEYLGYYAGCDRATGAINLWAQDRDRQVGKDGLIRGVGIKTALSIEKFQVDMLGRIYPALPENRRGLA